jgi:imidazole glycerol phosphate synthase subunit HisF
MNHDELKNGFAHEITRTVSEMVDIPVILRVEQAP